MAFIPINYDALLVVIIVLVGAWVLRQIDRRWGYRFTDDCSTKLRRLQEAHDREREELEGRINWLVTQLMQAGVPPKITPAEKLLPTKPLLLVVGPAQDIYAEDREALRRARIPFHRLVNATKHTISNELRARRQDGTLYPWIHVSSHANEQGVELADGMADGAWWHNQLDGVKVVFLAACKTDHVATALAGLVTVIYTTEDIDNETGGALTYAFWRRMKEHANARRAYEQAIEECPAAGEYTNIREH